MSLFLRDLIFALVLIGLIGAGVYSFMIAPRQREWRRRQELVNHLNIGTRVLTYGGMVGVVKNVDTKTGLVTVTVADGIDLEFVASAIMQEFDSQAYAEAAQKHLTRNTG
jgi:preprotein translocase subunit YajC